MDTSLNSTTSDRPRNLGLDFLNRECAALSDFDGLCGELVDGIVGWLGESLVVIMYIDPGDNLIPRPGDMWRYHMVAIVDDLVHDPWYPDLVLPPQEYVERAFPGQDLEISFSGEEDSETIRRITAGQVRY